MSTRSSVHFGATYPTEVGGEPEWDLQANVYRHWDGFPERVLPDMRLFFDELSGLADRRFNDPTYLAAKFVVWQAFQFTRNKSERLNFLGVGVQVRDPGDLDYRYEVDSGEMDHNGYPTVRVYRVGSGEAVEITNEARAQVERLRPQHQSGPIGPAGGVR